MSQSFSRLTNRCIAALAGVLLCGSAALAQEGKPEITYPPSTGRADLTSWLQKETDVRPETVVAVSPDAVTSILQSRPVGGFIAVILRGEVISSEAFDRDKVLSWHATVQVDCKTGKVRQGATTGYGARNLLFESRPIRPADLDWLTPVAGDALEAVRKATCERGFQGPLSDAPVPTVERAPVARAAEAPAPTATPKPVAPKPPPPRAAAPAPAPVATPAPRPVKASSVVAQLAAAGSDAEAQRVLVRAQSRFGEAMTNLQTRVEKATVGGKIYYRAVVFGFTDKAAAGAFCAALKTSDQACFLR